MSVFAYCRVSTDRQADDGESLDVQRRMITGYAMQHGWTVDREYVERGVSGSVPLTERPEGRAMLAALKPGDIIITTRLDRMFRSALDALTVLGDMKDRHISLHMIDLGGDVSGNGISKLVFTILSAVAEAERDRIRERIADVKRDQRARGRFLGGPVPFGYIVDDTGALIVEPAQQAAIVRMHEMRAAGASLRTIASAIKAEGHSISHAGVQTVLSRVETNGADNHAEVKAPIRKTRTPRAHVIWR